MYVYNNFVCLFKHVIKLPHEEQRVNQILIYFCYWKKKYFLDVQNDPKYIIRTQ